MFAVDPVSGEWLGPARANESLGRAMEQRQLQGPNALRAFGINPRTGEWVGPKRAAAAVKRALRDRESPAAEKWQRELEQAARGAGQSVLAYLAELDRQSSSLSSAGGR